MAGNIKQVKNHMVFAELENIQQIATDSTARQKIPTDIQGWKLFPGHWKD